ncbi:MAG: tetratricopeptide repeat protein [Chamaesiphon sp.]|nr:tetratricopeptide repeat protein [Chamaesiphon sp.]
MDPENASAYYNRGAIEYELGNRQAAASDFDRTVLLNPQSAEKDYQKISKSHPTLIANSK